MKDLIKEFEDLNNRIDVLFEGLGFLNPMNWLRNKSAEPSMQNPNASYKRGPELTKYLQGVESGDECAPGVSNKRFSSEPGNDSAFFYNKKGEVTGTVDNIKPLLYSGVKINGVQITKKSLRCYDLARDPLKIKWLFDGKFHAETLGWNPKKRKIIFQGEWESGLFNGIENIQPGRTQKAQNTPSAKKSTTKLPHYNIKLPKAKGKGKVK